MFFWYARKTSWKDGSTTKEEHASYIGDAEYITYVNDPSLLSTHKTRINDSVVHVKSVAINPFYIPTIPTSPVNFPTIPTTTFEYIHRDHLGSITAVTNGSGQALLRTPFEPFGARKSSDWQSNISSADLTLLLTNTYLLPRFSRGFTGHEHLDRTGFIHMNGRVYDPQLGRFLSPDPMVQAPSNSQSWNRYAYVSNNPLRFTDPSGYSSDEPPEETVTTGRRPKVKDGVRVYRVRFNQTGSRITRRFTFVVVNFAAEGRPPGEGEDEDDEQEGDGQEGHPDFEGMSNQVLVDWVVQNRQALGIGIRDGVSVFVQNEYLGVSDSGLIVDCQGDPACNGRQPLFGLQQDNSILVFNHTFDGINTLALPGKNGGLVFRGVNFNRVESVIHIIAHEGAHSLGVGSGVEAFGGLHPNAEQAGYNAVLRFRRLYP